MMEISSPEEMQALGARLGVIFAGTETIELVGDVGAGKTTLVRGIAQGMDVDETVQSPSFTISRQYVASDNRRLVHYDFYRLADPGIMKQELEETIGTRGTVVVIEWANAVEEILPDDVLRIEIIAPEPHLRHISLVGNGPVSLAIVEQLR